MSESSSFDCYLCGSHNEPNAPTCQRCNGQLLHIPSDEPNAVDEVSTEPVSEVAATDGLDHLRESADSDNAGSKKLRSLRGRSINLQDQRLSDALGLAPDTPDEAPIAPVTNDMFAETVVTSIPRATQSSDIPLLGTRAGAVPQSAMSTRETGPKTYALLALLLVFTGWFGYNTITRSPLTQPDSIAFVSTTAGPSTTTTSTEAPRRQWQLNEVQGQYNFVFARVEFYSCPAEGGPQLLGDERNGIILNTHNVLVAEAPAGAAVALIRNRTGQGRTAIIDRTADGLTIATSTRQTTRTLVLADAVGDPATFYVGYDPTTNVTRTLEESNPAVPSEILVTAFGDTHSVRLDGNSYTAEALSQVNIRYEVDPDIGAANNPTICTTAAQLKRVDEASTAVVQPETTDPATSDDDSVVPDEE